MNNDIIGKTTLFTTLGEVKTVTVSVFTHLTDIVLPHDPPQEPPLHVSPDHFHPSYTTTDRNDDSSTLYVPSSMDLTK